MISSCGGGGGGGGGGEGGDNASSQSLNVTGAAHKGPFVIGSTVIVSILNREGKGTDSTVVTRTINDAGYFSFDINEPSLVQINVAGYFRNEITGQLSQGTLDLRAVYQVTGQNAQSAYVNILTHMASERILGLLAENSYSVKDAVTQAESELVIALEKIIPSLPESEFNSLSIYADDSSIGSSYLLALSSIFYKYAILKSEGNNTSADAELTYILNELTSDFGEDGAVDSEQHINELKAAIPYINPELVINNLRKISVESGLEYEVANLNEYLDTDLDGIYNSVDIDDDGDGVDDVIDSSPFERGFEAVDQELTTGEDASLNIDILSNNPRNEEISYSLLSSPMNGRLEGSFPHVTYIPNENFYGADHFKVQLSQRYVIDKEIKISIVVMPENDSPILLGEPQTKVIAFSNYEFTPTVINVEEDVLEFSIKNKPSWADFDSVTGVMSGVPNNNHVGKSENVEIVVSDGETKATVGPFAVEVGYYPWSVRNDMPSPRSSASASVLGGNIYVIGGNLGGIALSTVEEYTPEDDAWRVVGALQTARSGHSSNAVNGKIYVVGGGVTGGSAASLATVEEYDKNRGTWRFLTPAPTGRKLHASCVVDDKIYVIGGYLFNNHFQPTSSVEMYDPVTDTWAQKAPIPRPRSGTECGVLNGKIYVIGEDQDPTLVSVYDPLSDSWQRAAYLNEGRKYGHTVVTVNDKLYVIGGSSTEMIHQGIGAWEQKTSMPESFYNTASAVMDDVVYLFGGRDANTYARDSVIVYEPTKESR